MNIKFTKSEWEILLHRLEMPDAIAECLTSNEPELFDEFLKRIESISLVNHEIKVGTFEHTVIKECAEGSTYFCNILDAVAIGEITKVKQTSMNRARKSLERKLDIEVPLYH